MTLTYEAVASAIASGALDADLTKLSSAIDTRTTTIRATRTQTDFGIGDQVKLNNSCGTRYLVGATARVVGKKRTKIVITLDNPVGRFARVNPITRQMESAQITVPISIVDPV